MDPTIHWQNLQWETRLILGVVIVNTTALLHLVGQIAVKSNLPIIFLFAFLCCHPDVFCHFIFGKNSLSINFPKLNWRLLDRMGWMFYGKGHVLTFNLVWGNLVEGSACVGSLDISTVPMLA